MNKVILMWNITQDLEMKQIQNWHNVLSFSIATNRSVKKWDNWEDKATFHNIVAWGKKAEAISNFFSKWKKILLDWLLENRSWEAEDWTKRYKTEILLENFYFVQSKSDNSNDEFAKTDKQTFWNKNKSEEISVEDIPF